MSTDTADRIRDLERTLAERTAERNDAIAAALAAVEAGGIMAREHDRIAVARAARLAHDLATERAAHETLASILAQARTSIDGWGFLAWVRGIADGHCEAPRAGGDAVVQAARAYLDALDAVSRSVIPTPSGLGVLDAALVDARDRALVKLRAKVQP